MQTMKNIILGLIMHLWNILIEYQKPVIYTCVETPNRYSTHENKVHDLGVIFEVKQLKFTRRPRWPYRTRTRYTYEVTQYIFKEGKILRMQTHRFPEMCSFLFRNTKIPHVLAINAFLNTIKDHYGGDDENHH